MERNVDKAVITTILTYVMVLFRLPKRWCEDIAKLIARFWWNGRDERKKIHWVRWSVLTMAKDIGECNLEIYEILMRQC